MLPIYKVQSLDHQVFSSILQLENLPHHQLAILTFGELCYIIAEGFVRAVIQAQHIDRKIKTTRLSRSLIHPIND